MSKFMGEGLHICMDGFRFVYVCIAAVMWAAAGTVSLEYMQHYKNRSRYYLFFWATFAATVGVFLSADLLTTFLFFEIMSFTSYVWVAFDERPESLRAAETYLAVAVSGGMAMLMGLFLLKDLFGTLEIKELTQAALSLTTHIPTQQMPCALGDPQRQLYVAAVLLFIGFGAKAGCFPLHIWLPKAHPVAPAPASALLSGILTKTGIFGIIIVSCGMMAFSREWGLFVALLGFVTMFWGAFLAVFSVNLKKTLACSSVSQIGFILSGIGIGVLSASAGQDPGFALRGAFLHMCNHSMFKLILFLCAAVVYQNLHELELNEIRGFGRGKYLLMFCFAMGALGISGIPLWSGYVSKTLIHEGIVEYMEFAAYAGWGDAWAGARAFWKVAECVFLLTGGMTFAYMLKLFFVLFLEKNQDPQKQKNFDAMSGHFWKPTTAAAIIIPACTVWIMGMFPNLTMDRIAKLGEGFFGLTQAGHAVRYFAFKNLKGGLISITIGLMLYFIVIRFLLVRDNRYLDCFPRWCDLENMLYRPLLQKMLPTVCGFVCRMLDTFSIQAPLCCILSVSRVVCRVMDQLTDGLILAARKTTHSQRPPAIPRLRPESAVKRARLLSGVRQNIAYTVALVEESFSFGLLLASGGLCIMLGYLLYVFLRG